MKAAVATNDLLVALSFLDTASEWVWRTDTISVFQWDFILGSIKTVHDIGTFGLKVGGFEVPEVAHDLARN